MSRRTLIIAEAGVNHNGSLEVAKKLIDEAVEAGVDIVKFQTFKAEKLVSKKAIKADYQKQATGSDDSQFSMLKKLELSENDHDELIAYCALKKIEFLSTPFDIQSISLLVDKGLKIGKIPSGEITNLPYLEAMGRAFPDIILSTGMATMEEVEAAISVFLKEGVLKDHITVLHCNTEYPTPMEDVNLMAMVGMKQKFGVSVGYSDHTLGIEVPIAAVALGAEVIEKHFTLDKNMEGPDHRASLEPAELKTMVSAIRNIENAISGSGAKVPSTSEKKNMSIARKSIHLDKALAAGHVIEYSDLAMKRPGTGISPMQINKVVGKKLKADLPADHLLSFEDFN
ncbi:MAG: N-acetylneuraminate synthase [Sphingobacteriales bacterium]|nr:MAG: N-acetylneuraminate synthase [Sphingobacteriales bacterium]